MGTFLTEEIAAPLGLWIGPPKSEQHRVSRIIASVPDFEALSRIDLDALPEAVRDGGSLGFADPATGLAFGYVMNHIKEGTTDPRVAVLVDAVRTAMKGI